MFEVLEPGNAAPCGSVLGGEAIPVNRLVVDTGLCQQDLDVVQADNIF